MSLPIVCLTSPFLATALPMLATSTLKHKVEMFFTINALTMTWIGHFNSAYSKLCNKDYVLSPYDKGNVLLSLYMQFRMQVYSGIII